jgi:hypothetical protein
MVTVTDSTTRRKDVQAPETDLESLQTVYQETVLATDHYEEEYDESLIENIRREFGPEYATALMTNTVLTPQLQQAFMQASYAAANKRADFLCTLDSEITAMTEACRRLSDIIDNIDQLRGDSFEWYSFAELVSTEERLEALKNECETLIQDRQTNLLEHPNYRGMTLQEYLYQECEWNHPVISDALTCLSWLNEIEQQVLKAVVIR